MTTMTPARPSVWETARDATAFVHHPPSFFYLASCSMACARRSEQHCKRDVRGCRSFFGVIFGSPDFINPELNARSMCDLWIFLGYFRECGIFFGIGPKYPAYFRGCPENTPGLPKKRLSTTRENFRESGSIFLTPEKTP
jgi:hypothetical protein